jgi:hypothetical protein
MCNSIAMHNMEISINYLNSSFGGFFSNKFRIETNYISSDEATKLHDEIKDLIDKKIP